MADQNLTSEELRDLLDFGSEQTSVEFKQGGPRSDQLLFGKTLRAMLAMANHRGGGLVVLGIAEDEVTRSLRPGAMSSDDLLTWNKEHLADAVAPYADPHLEFATSHCDLDGLRFLVIRIKEFSDVPVLCKKQLTVRGDVYIREGACLVRPRHKPGSIDVPGSADMRDLLDLATEKALRRFLSTAQSVGIQAGKPLPSDDELFAAQLGELQ
jgi:predicted HTH transcriptional regulator